MAFWSKWFSPSEGSAASGPVKTFEYKGYVIGAVPYKDGGQWQLAGRISKDGKEHNFVRADKFSSKEEAADIAISKGQLIIDQSGESIFR
jgi:hypothetical protein